MDLPVNVQTGMVTARYVADVIDGADANLDPDALPVRGRIVFTSSVPYLPVPTAEPDPVTIMRAPIVGVLDADGYLCTPHPGTLEPQYRGVFLIATDDPDVAVKDWTWDVTYLFDQVNGHKLSIPAHGFSLPTFDPIIQNSVDLTLVAKVPSSPGYSLPQAEAAVLRAESAAAASATDAANAIAAAERAEQAAAATDEGITGMLSDPGTQSGGLLESLLAPKADAEGVGLALAGKADRQSVEAALADKADAGITTQALAAKADAADLEAKQDKLTEDLDDPGILGAGPGNKIPTVDSNYNLPAKVLAWLATKFVGKGEMSVNVKDYGAKGDGVADDTAAWIAAEAAAYAKGADYVLSAPYGLYRTSGQITIRCALDAGQATLRYYGTGTALVIGDESIPGKVTPRRKFSLPRVINMSRGNDGWDGTSVGVRLTNLDTCNLTVPFIQNFEQGLILNGHGAGVAYNNINLGALWNNRKNLVLTNDSSGWANQNTFLGGRLNHNISNGAVLDDMGANQVHMASDTAAYGGPNNNTFIGTSFEGVNLAYYRLDISGKYNKFINCRWENFGTPFRVRYRENAEWNSIDGGYNAAQITEIFDGTRGGGSLTGNLGFYARAFNTGGQLIPDNVATPITTWNTPTLAGVTYDSATGRFKPRPGRWMITASTCFAPNATGRRIMRLEQDAAALEIAELTPGATRNTMKCVAVERFNGQQTFSVAVTQTSGAPLALDVSTPYVKITANYLGH